jgi:hypothetical protein
MASAVCVAEERLAQPLCAVSQGSTDVAVGRWAADGAHLQAELRDCEGRTPGA